MRHLVGKFNQKKKVINGQEVYSRVLSRDVRNGILDLTISRRNLKRWKRKTRLFLQNILVLFINLRAITFWKLPILWIRLDQSLIIKSLWVDINYTNYASEKYLTNKISSTVAFWETNIRPYWTLLFLWLHVRELILLLIQNHIWMKSPKNFPI